MAEQTSVRRAREPTLRLRQASLADCDVHRETLGNWTLAFPGLPILELKPRFGWSDYPEYKLANTSTSEHWRCASRGGFRLNVPIRNQLKGILHRFDLPAKAGRRVLREM
jgi:hypothetical protein